MKVLTLGWLSVFLYIFLMNLYIWNRYWSIPFVSFRLLKVSTYLVIQVILVLLTLYYFYLFFNGKAESGAAKPLAYVAAFYLTLLHYSFIFYLIHDVVNLSSRHIAYPLRLRVFGGTLFYGGFLIFLIASSIALYGMHNAKKVVIKNYEITIPQKESSLEKLEIVYVSDAHFGTSVNRDNLDLLVETIEKMEGDILLLGGDLFDEGTSLASKQIVSQALASIDTPLGIVAIEGNHEYKSGQDNIDEELAFLAQAGITTLQDEIIEIEDSFYIIGRKDPEGDPTSLKSLVAQTTKDLPIIVLDHRPSYKESANLPQVDLQISGHTHSGQFFPMKYIEPLTMTFFKQTIYGHHQIGNLEQIVSSGVGNWGIPVRIGSKRELLKITVHFQ